MKYLASGAIAFVLAFGLAGCDNQQRAEETSAQTQPQAQPQPETPPPASAPNGPEDNPRSVAPAEPIDPLNTPSEPPDAGTHGISDGAMVPEGSAADPSGGGTSGTEAEQVPVAPGQ